MHNSKWIKTPENSIAGVALNVKEGMRPINGMRIAPVGDSNGWFIWAGTTFSDAADFFKPTHAGHIHEWCPEILRLLGLAPGWRFLWDGDYLDVWFDAELLKSPTGASL
jgi:hypothetical protein